MNDIPKVARLMFWWGCAFLAAWVCGRFLIWNLLSWVFDFSVRYYDTLKALVGMLIFLIASLVFSFQRDKDNAAAGSNAVQDPIDGIEIGAPNAVRELAVFALRIDAGAYAWLYWLNQDANWHFQAAESYDRLPYAWILLLAGLTWLIAILVTAGIALEPWRALAGRMHPPAVVTSPAQTAFQLLAWRLIWLLLSNLILFWFFLPFLGSQLDSAGVFVVIVIALLVVSRMRRNK